MRLLREEGVNPPRMTGIDLAFESLLLAKKQKPLRVVRGDIDALPFAPCSFDGVIMASVLQWLGNPMHLLHCCSEILRDGGYCVFSIFVNESFQELRETRRFFGLADSVRCPSDRELLRFFQSPPFTLLEYELVRETIRFPDAMSLLKSISATGAAATMNRKLPRRELAALCEQYEKKFRDASGVPLTWAALIGTSGKKAAP